jgi:3-hydroxyisobutyrate dehydrogenase
MNRGHFDSGFGLRLMLKDMQVALQLERAAGIPAPLSQAAVDAWASAAATLPADADHTEIARWLGYRAPGPGDGQ